MRINSIDNSTNFGNRYVQKVFKGQLKDNSTAYVRLILGSNEQVRAIESYQYKDGELLNAIGFTRNFNVKLTDLATFLNKLQSNEAEGVDFIKKFAIAMR